MEAKDLFLNKRYQPPTCIPFGQKVDLSQTQWAFTVVQQLNLPGRQRGGGWVFASTDS
jgi:hypothetical protein